MIYEKNLIDSLNKRYQEMKKFEKCQPGATILEYPDVDFVIYSKDKGGLLDREVYLIEVIPTNPQIQPEKVQTIFTKPSDETNYAMDHIENHIKNIRNEILENELIEDMKLAVIKSDIQKQIDILYSLHYLKNYLR